MPDTLIDLAPESDRKSEAAGEIEEARFKPAPQETRA